MSGWSYTAGTATVTTGLHPIANIDTLRGDGAYCFAHDPGRAAEREAARRKGGAHTAKTIRLGRLVPSTLRPVLDALLLALDETHRGDLDPKRAGVLAALAGAIVRVYSAGELEERLRQLEAVQAVAEIRRGA